jgi:hypothetical protein
MRDLATLPKPVLLLEVLGVLAVIGALLLTNDWVNAPDFIAKKPLATLLFFSRHRVDAACRVDDDVAHGEGDGSTIVQSFQQKEVTTGEDL